MEKKHISILLTLFLVINCMIPSFSCTAYATESGEPFYRVEKILNEKNSSVQINLNVEDNIEVDHVIMPDQTIVENDLIQYVYSVEKNGSYQFVLYYEDVASEEVQELAIPVDVTEIVEQDTVKPDTEKEPANRLEPASQERKLENDSLDAVYVSQNGDDESGEGTKNSPFATLAKAVTVAKDGATVYLLNDLTISDSVRIINKSITIDGQGYTVKRGEIKPVQDNARSTYNPAMIEINNWNQNTEHHVLTLRNIVLDDDGRVEGSDYSQQSTDGTYNNANKVQDAIIASYTTNDIVLGNGTVLQNYAGMSAVRITANAELIMEPGSKIVDTNTMNRGHKTESTAKTGQAGAVWIQGGVFEMNAGSYIGSSAVQMSGRAIYIDDGKASINGTILNLKGSNDMWFGQEGVALHIRNDAQAILESQGEIDTIQGEHSTGRAAVRTNGGEADPENYAFEAKEGSVITNVTGIAALYSNYGRELLNGHIENCTNDSIIAGFAQNTTIGKTGVIENCVGKGTWNSANAIVYTSNASKIFMNGTMQNNEASYAFYIINQSGGPAQLEMNEGAKLIGKGSNTGVYINASGSSFTMNGGEISQFSRGVNCRGKAGRSATFTMNGGSIHDNSSYGLYFDCYSGSKSVVNLNGGTIENNGTYEVYLPNGQAQDLYEHLNIHSGVIKGNRSVKVPLGTVILDENYEDVQVGNAKSKAVDKIKELVNAKEEYEGWTVAGSSALWIKPSTDEVHFKLSRPYSAQKTGLFVTGIPLNEDGTPEEDAQLLSMEEIENAESLDITLKGLRPDTSYAVMLVNNDEYTLTPDDIAVYTGGGQGEETSNTGFPEYTLSHSLDDIESLAIDNKDTGLSGEEALDKLKELLTITYTNESGEVVNNDMTAGEYTAKLSLNDQNTEIRINGNEVKIDDQGGLLIVRHISNKEEAISGEITYPLVSEEPTEKLEHAVAIAKKPIWGSARFYVNGDTDRQVDDTTGISLLDDDLLVDDENDNRQKLMEDKAKNYLDIQDELGTLVHYDFHYLDLVDAFDGNAWVSASEGTTVYLPYPQGTDATTEFRLVHYKDLHREYGIHGQLEVEEAINNCQLETMNIEKLSVGIKFDVGSSGFSPFALVWTEETGTSTVTVNYLDKETNQSLLEADQTKVTIGDDYDVTDKTNRKVDGYHMDSIDGAAVGRMSQDGVVVTVYYQNDAPVIHAEDLQIESGTDFDPLKDVTAYDTEDGDLTKHIKVTENSVDRQKAGTYKVVYEVTDKGGKTTSLTISVTVSDKLPVDGNTNTGDNGSVNTGDNGLSGRYTLLTFISLFAFGGLVYRKKKRQNRI